MVLATTTHVGFGILFLSESTGIFFIVLMCSMFLTDSDQKQGIFRNAIFSIVLGALSALTMTINNSSNYYSFFFSVIAIVAVLYLFEGSVQRKIFFFTSVLMTYWNLVAFSHIITNFIGTYYGYAPYLSWFILLFRTAFCIVGVVLGYTLIRPRVLTGLEISPNATLWVQLSVYPSIVSIATVLLYVPNMLELQENLQLLSMLFWIVFGTVLFQIISKYLVVSARNYEKNTQLQSMNKLFDMQRQYYTMLRESLDKSRIIRHDFHHHLNVIAALNQEGKREEIADYLNMIEASIASAGVVRFCPNGTVNAVLSNFYTLAKEKNINFVATVNIPDDFENIDSLDLSIVLGNLLENAFRAVDEDNHALQDKKVEFKCKYVDDKLLISIVNGFYGKVKVAPGGKYLTTKEGEGGIGLRSVGVIAEKYAGDLVIHFDDSVFSVYVTLINAPKEAAEAAE